MRLLKRSAIALIALIILGEILARWGLGLGTPPLSIPGPGIEYMFAPNQDVYRFHNHQVYNELGMRGPPLDQVEAPRRVMVFGDSVLNGGNLTDQAELATTLASDAQTFFGNVSAGSWGPANMGAWIDKYGFLGAQTSIFVLSSHDLTDLPTFAQLDPQSHPTKRPVSALLEGLERYLPRYLPIPGAQGGSEIPAASSSAEDRATGAREIEKLLVRARNAGVKVCLIQHATETEAGNGLDHDADVIRAIFTKRDVPVISDETQLKASLRAGTTPYRDDIHINAKGQLVLKRLLRECARVARLPVIAAEGIDR